MAPALAARAASVGKPWFRSGSIGPLLAGTEHVPPFGDYRNAWGVKEGSGSLCAKQIRYVLEKEGDVAAFHCRADAGRTLRRSTGFWKEVRSACDDTGTLLVFERNSHRTRQDWCHVLPANMKRSLPTFSYWARVWAVG